LQHGGLAGVTIDIAPAVAGGLDALGACLVVPAAIAPALLVRVRQPAVELDGELVLLVVSVPVRGLAVDDHAHLMPGPRQAVGPLHIAQIPVFEHRLDPVASGREHIAEFGAPAHFLAPRQCGPELFLGGQPPAASARYPAAGIVERPGEVNQVEHGLLDARPGRLPAGLAGLADASRHADDDARGGRARMAREQPDTGPVWCEAAAGFASTEEEWHGGRY
jgi:hypothetical protein